MLYVTIRNDHDAYTAYRAIHEPVGSDGGAFLPFRMPTFSSEEIASFQEASFGQCVADILNRFFSCGLTGWDVDFMAGRHAAKLASVTQRVTVAELWHNAEASYEHLEKVLTDRICGEAAPNSWVRIAVRISVLTGVYAMLLRSGQIAVAQVFDVAVPTGDFAVPMAVWYFRQMGFPVANIICCSDNSAVWELLQQGQMRTDIAAKKNASAVADSGIPAELERLIAATLGCKEACRYSEAVKQGAVYSPPVGTFELLRKGITASVISSQRLSSAIPNVYSTAGYLMGPCTALGYSGLMDYRAKTGLRRPALLLADRSPLCDTAFVCEAMRWTETELRENLI